MDDRAVIVIAHRTDTGPIRELNEDAILSLTPEANVLGVHLVAIADGLGGHAAGEVASRLVIDALAQAAATPSGDRPERWLRRAFTAANLALHDHALSHPEAFNLQSTATALVLHGDQAYIGHVGDCRAYLVREGEIELCTTDHTRAMEMMRLRLITPEQAITHPARNQLTRSLGAELMMAVDIIRQPLRAGDTWVLCSDGLWSEISREDIAEVVSTLDPAAAADQLVQTACDRSAPDNVSVAIVKVERAAPAAANRNRRWFSFR